MTKRENKKSKSQKDVIGEENKEEEIEVEYVRVNWPRITLLGFITSLVFTFINVIILIILIFGFSWTNMDDLNVVIQILFFGETGLVVFFGACIGNFGQSIVLTNIKTRLFKSEPMNRNSFREATFNAFTYYFAGAFLLVYLMATIQILKLVMHYS